MEEPDSEAVGVEISQYTKGNHKIPIGQIHNEVLTAFNARHDLLSGKKMPVDDFVPMFIESMYEVYERHELPFNVTDKQVIGILDAFAELKDKGVANFFEIPSEIPVPLIEYLTEEGVISKNSGEYYTRGLQDILNRYASGLETDRKAIRFLQRTGGNSAQDDLFVEIACYSSEFWINLQTSQSESILFTSRDDDDDEENLDDWLDKQNAIMTICWDALGGFVGQLLAGPAGAVLGLIIASVAYTVIAD